MTIHHRAAALLKAGLAGLTLAAAAVSCGGGGGDDEEMTVTPPVSTITSAYTATSLVTEATGGAPNTDAKLLNAWGIAFNPNGFVWVANEGSSTSTLYDGNGVPQTLVVAIPAGTPGAARPTGIVFNGSQDFKVTQNGVTGASPFIFAGLGGTIAGWSPAVNLNNAVTTVDTGSNGAFYTGLAIGNSAGANYIYAPDFRRGGIDVYDTGFQKVTLPGGGFVDPGLPPNYAPFGVQAVGDRVYVSYAQRGANGTDRVAGAGLGLINVFSTGGAFVGRLVTTGGVLNAPWGMAIAPADFGDFSNMLLVANRGDGKINAFSPHDGKLIGTLMRSDRTPIVIDGLYGIAFGNGIQAQPRNALFFTAGPGNGTRGLYGRIQLQ
ncbi:TIGR03118 family protein [Massilia sp. ZL223]|uniref:TIGR03118 family protein n=1 Tax=Massilia sp. ZL223 TaxID=2824904 RepID=UPI001B8256D1|nr:TIGR03118 family protein [Massilia sp. ZL223]MBQ5964688.1 TIGR03118 family protein [Massilia sp. ZL223]